LELIVVCQKALAKIYLAKEEDDERDICAAEIERQSKKENRGWTEE